MKGYKVLRKVGSKLYSVNGEGNTPLLNRQYKVGVKNVPDPAMLRLGYGLFFFDTLENAQSFSCVDEIWLVETGKKVWEPAIPSYSVYNPDTMGYFRTGLQLLAYIKRSFKSRYAAVWPEGSKLTTSIRLIEKLR